jgi:hypothetical protein
MTQSLFMASREKWGGKNTFQPPIAQFNRSDTSWIGAPQAAATRNGNGKMIDN